MTWRRIAVLAASALASLVVLGGVAVPHGALAAGQPYSFNWNGTPATPLAWSDRTWDVLVHERDTTFEYPAVEPMQAVHGPNCEPPPTTHPTATAPDSVFVCKNHLMTALLGSDYGLITLTPSQEVDFTSGASITYSVSTLRTSLRDWTDIWITPFNENLLGPLESWLPDLQGNPKDAVHVKMNVFNGGTIFTAEVYNNFNSTAIGCVGCVGLLEQKLSTSAATRTPFELDLSPTHLKFGIPSLNLWWIDDPATIPFTRGIVQIEHHSYNPSKDCNAGDVGSTPGCPPNTWHWSNFGISNAVPFTMIKPDLPNFIGPATVHFATPAPASAFLRFHAIGVGLQVSLNGGNFAPATEARELGVGVGVPPFIRDEHFKSYWMPIPAGTSSVSFIGQSWTPGGGAFRVQDVSIWSENGATPPPPPPAAAPAAYTAVTPVRLLDTRNAGGPLGPAGSRTLTVAGVSPVPAGATAVVLNVTVTDTTAAGYLTVYPMGASQPLASNLNWTAGKTVPNLVSVQVGTAGAITFYNGAGSADVVVDLEGYFAPPSGTAGGEVALTSARITDTRAGIGQANAGKTLGARSTLNIQVTGVGGVPATGVSGAILNVTATNTTATTGALTVWPTGAAQPVASNLNWLAGQTVPNRAFVPVGTGGQVSLFNFAGSTDVVVDVSGYFTDATATGKQFSAVSPVRLIDTRDTGQTLGAGGTLTLQVGGVGGVPRSPSAVILNVTVTNTSGPSFLIAYPSTAVRPTASDLNWVGGQTASNMVVATLGPTGALTFYNGAGSTDVVVDLAGWYS